jgi:hypothetical protein
VFGFHKLIKISGKSKFDQLTWPEFGELIDSFFDGGNASFDAIAFNEFLHWNVKDSEITRLQRELNEHAFVKRAYGAWPDVNEGWLRALSAQLKSGDYPPQESH